MSFGGANPQPVTPDGAANFGSLASWADSSKGDWLASWANQITGIATSFLNWEQAIDDIVAIADIDLGDMIKSAFAGIKGIIFTFFPWFQKLEEFLGGIDLISDDGSWDVGAAVKQFFDNMVNPFNLVKATLDRLIDFGFLPKLSISSLTLGRPNLILNGAFNTAASIGDTANWFWVDTDGHSGPGQVYTAADGTTKSLVSNLIDVDAGQHIDISAWFKWTDLVYTGTSPIRLEAIAYADNVPLDVTVVDFFASPPANAGGWSQLSDTYTVPSGADNVVVQLVLDAAATGGVLRADDVVARKQFLEGLLPQNIVNGLTGALSGLVSNFQGIIDTAWNAIFGGDGNPGHDLGDLFNALKNIPGANVLGFGGNLLDTFQDTWDRLVGGFFRFPTFGKGAADVANAASNTANTADTALQVAEWSNALLGIRNNKSIMDGIDETEESTFNLGELMTGVTDPPNLSVTAAGGVPIAFWRATEEATKGFVSWFGKGITNITGIFIDLYKMNYTTNTMELLHSSPDQSGQVPASAWGYCVYNMTIPNRIHVVAGDVLGIGIRVTGTGTHQIAAKLASWFPSHPTVHPAKPGAQKTGTGNVAFGSIAYSGTLPWFGIGIITGDIPPAYNAPRTTIFDESGAFTFNVPDWADTVDCIKLGAGGGGHGGNPVFGTSGVGGLPGQWVAETLVRGVDFPDVPGATISGVVGAYGAAGPYNNNGGNGGATIRNAIPGGKAVQSAPGGQGGQYTDNEGHGDKHGDSPGNFSYNGINYIGGGGASGGMASNGNAGDSPGGGGGGGSGGTWGVAWDGGRGANGAAWFVARQAT